MDEFARHCAELLSPLGPVRQRPMFGGHGLYVGDLFVALIAGEQFYLKTDAETQPQFEAAGCLPFQFSKKDGELVSIRYYCPPEEAMESAALMLPWARLALQAALRAQAAKALKALKRPRAPRKKA